MSAEAFSDKNNIRYGLSVNYLRKPAVTQRGEGHMEHDDFGETAFYDLSPVHQTLYYSSFPEIDID